MSTNLYYRKVTPKKEKTLCTGLKWPIERHYGRGPVILTTRDVLFLQGVMSTVDEAGKSDVADDCQALIDLILESDSGVEVWIAE